MLLVNLTSCTGLFLGYEQHMKRVECAPGLLEENVLAVRRTVGPNRDQVAKNNFWLS